MKTIEQHRTEIQESVIIEYLLVLAAALSFYIGTCAPTILWQDSGLFVYRIWHNDLEGNLGLALAHPLYIMIGIVVKYLPWGDLAYRINLISAFFGALTVANLFLFLRIWLNKFTPAILAAITLALSWNFWQHSVIAEVYTLCTAQIFTELIFLLIYLRTSKISFLYLLAFLNGLTIANHLWGIFGFICYVIFIIVLLFKKRLFFKQIAFMILLWVIGALPYEYIIIKNIIQSGNLIETLVSAAFGNNWKNHVLNVSISINVVLENMIFIAINFPTPNFILFFIGLWTLRKKFAYKPLTNILLALLAIYFVFAFRYTVPDRYAFFIPFYCLTAVFIGIGADTLLTRYRSRPLIITILLLALLPIPAYFLTPDIARAKYKSLGQRRQKPYRDEYDYFLKPWKNKCTSAQRFAQEALQIAAPNSIIYAYTTDVHALLYTQQVKGKRTDVKILSGYDKSENAPEFNQDTIGNLIKERTIYVTSSFRGYCPDFILDNFDLNQESVLWRVVEPLRNKPDSK